MPIDEAEVRRIAALARLRLDDRAVPTLRRQLESILDHVRMLDRLDVGDVPPTSAPRALGPSLRADRPAGCLAAEEALSNAPDAAAGMFRVPRVLKG